MSNRMAGAAASASGAGALAFLTLMSTASISTLAHAQARQPELLPPVDVTASTLQETRAGPVDGYRALTAASATKTATPIEQLPQNIQVIPRSVIDGQAATSVSEAVRNVSNVQPLDSRVIGNVEQVPIKIHGFGAELWTDGYLGNLFGVGDREGMVNVERIEVLKGPNALLYGGGGGSPVGGTINLVSKLPTDTPFYQLGGTVGSYGYWSPFFDVNQPLTKDGTALFRLTGEYTGSKSFIDVLSSDRYSINPTLTLTNRSSTSLTIQGFVSNHRQQAYPGLPVEGTLFASYRLRRELYFGDPNIERTYAKIHGMTATFDHQFNPVWSTNIKARWSQSELDQYSQSPFLDATGTGGTPFIPPSTFDLNNIQMFDKQREISFNPTVQAKFDVGSSRNTVLFGGDYSRVNERGFMTVDTLGNFCFLLGGGCPPAAVDLSNPIFGIPYTKPIVGAGETSVLFDYDTTYVTKALYTQVQSSLYDRVHLIGGARLASIDITYNEYSTGAVVPRVTDETKLLPRAGVVVDLVKGLSVYASYGEGMKWVPFSQTFAQPKAELSEQREAGIKFNLNDKLTGTLAAFEIDRDNVPVRLSATTAELTRQRSRGFEADLIYQPDNNWSFLGSYGYTRATFVDAGGPNIPAGNRLPFVPDQAARLWVNYAFDANVLPGWSVGAGIYVAAGQYVDAQNIWKTEGYFTIDAKIGYETDRIRAAVTGKNLTGEEYYTPYNWFGGQVAPGAPRMIYGQISYKFQ